MYNSHPNLDVWEPGEQMHMSQIRSEGPRTLMSEGRRWLSGSSRGWISPSATVLFYSGSQWIEWCPPKLVRWLSLLSLLIQMPFSSRNVLTDTPKNNVLWPIWASLSQSSWHINLTITPTQWPQGPIAKHTFHMWKKIEVVSLFLSLSLPSFPSAFPLFLLLF